MPVNPEAEPGGLHHQTQTTMYDSSTPANQSETNEPGPGPPIPEINQLIESGLARHGNNFTGQGRPDIHSRDETLDALNMLFREVLKESNQEK